MNSSRRLGELGLLAFLPMLHTASASAQGGPSIFPAPIHGGDLEESTIPKLAVGDISGDGLPDAVVGVRQLFTGGLLLVQLGDAYGGLEAPDTYPGGSFAGTPYALAIGDLTGDGIDDLAVSTYSWPTGYVVSVYSGNAQGMLAPPADYPQAGAGALAVGDVTGDGRPDLVVLESSQACVRAGDAQGTLDAPVCYALGGNNYVSVTVGDVDGGGRSDVVATNANRVCVLRGNAQGTLDPPACRATGGSDPAYLALGDLNGDSFDDAVLVDATRTLACVFPGNALGTLDPSICYVSGLQEIWSITVDDASADGRADVVLGGRGEVQDAGLVHVLKGNASGTLDVPVPYLPGLIRPRSIAVADLGADGRLEVLFPNATANDVCVLESDGQGGLETGDAYPTPGYGRLAVGDVSGDGRLDVVQADVPSDSVCVLAGNAQGTLDPPLCHPAGGDIPSSIAVGDLSGDTRLDVAVSTNSGVCVLAGNAQGSLDPAVCYPGVSGELAVGDVSGDSRPDVVVSTSAGVCVLKGNAQRSLDPPQCTSVPQGKVALGDVTGDGRLDAVVAHSAEVCVLAGNVLGTLDPPVCYPAGAAVPANDVAIGDLNGDGRLDVVVTYAAGPGRGEMCVLLGDAQGTLGPASCEYGIWIGVDIGDVNADGVADIVAGGFSSDSDGSPGGIYVGVREGGAHPGSGALRAYASPSEITSWLVLGDVDGDGRLDVVLPAVHVLENQFPTLGTVSCLGDAACPCANAGTGSRGCENSSSTGGARLHGDGVASLADDTVRLFASGEKPSALTIFLQGDTTIAPTNFGDGLRCAGGALKRLYVKNAAQGAVAAPLPADLSISARSAAAGDPLSAGDVRVYQTYYRDASATFCTAPTGSTFNASNALTVTWGQ